MASPGKRQLDDDTPRAKRIQTSDRSSHGRLSERSSSRARSGRSSPLKKTLRVLEHDPNGLEMRPLESLDEIPDALMALFLDVQAFANGSGIVSTEARVALADASSADARNFPWTTSGSDLWTDDPAVYTPRPEDVLNIKADTLECSRKRHIEANWNMEVHRDMLCMAFRHYPAAQRYKQLVNFTGATTAAIMPEYGHHTASKKVDFCVYAEPKNDATLTDTYWLAADRMRKALPEEVLNFTDFEGLDGRFIGLSIETKKPSEGLELSQLQLGVWEMARWRFLRRLAAGFDDENEDIFSAAETRAARAARLPAFLPGLIVQGDAWYFVATTAEGNRTVLWQKLFIGSSANTRGIYQIVRILQYLGKWVSDVYWPCVRRMLEEAE
ncbi:hypothetical protein NHJ13051_008517 [Beauveria bassiana]